MRKSVSTILATVSFCSIVLAQSQKQDTTIKQQSIEEVVVVGYTTKSKKELTNSISKVSEKVLQSAPRSNVATALQGTVAGVQVRQTTGQPGDTPAIRLRGGTAWDGSGSPLILIDGVPGSMYALNSEDIESFDVMKDAAATAVYGARGANGVIIITTKKGKKGKANVNFSAKTGYNFMRSQKLEYMNAADFVRMNRLAVKAYRDQINPNQFGAYLSGVQPAGTGNNTTNSVYTTMVLNDSNRYLLNQPGWQSIEDPINPGQYLIFMDNKWDNLYLQPSTTNDYNVSMEGGNDKATFYAGLGYMNDAGLVLGSNFRRINGTLNASYQIKDNLKASANVTYTRTNRNPTYLNSDWWIFERAGAIAPTARIYYNNPDGTLSDQLHPGLSINFGNPLYYQDKIVRENLEQRLTSSMQLDWQFAPKFNLMVRGSHFNVDDSSEVFNKAYINSGNLVTTRQSYYGINKTMRNQVTTVVSYKNTFGKHGLDALVGTEYFKQDAFSNYSQTKNSATDLIYTMNAGSEADGIPYSAKSRYSIGSLFSQVYYDYDNRYLLGITFRADGTSRLADTNRFDYFPGVSVGWNAHREAFYTNLGINNVINIFKPRISYGVNGNIDNLGDFTVYGAYSDAGIYNGGTGYRNTTLPNFALVWERAATANYGLDMSFLNNRITFTGDYFVKDVSNKISALVLPQWTGFSSINRNNGTLRIKGLELDVKTRVIQSEDFQWNLGFNYTSVRTYAKQLPPSSLPGNRQGGTQIYDPTTGEIVYVGGLEEGKRVGYDEVVTYVFDGVYKTQEEVDAANASGLRVTFAQNQYTRFLGDAKWKDINGDGIIDYRDRIVIGRTTPKFTGGFSTDFNYKNFTLYIRTDFAVGHLAKNYLRDRSFTQAQGAMNSYTEVLNTWTPDNPDSNLPRFVFTDPQGNYHQGNLLWEKGDYLALREITLSYNIKGSLFNNMVKNARIYATGSNLYYFTKYSGINPEIGGNQSGTFPIPVTFTLGVNATF